MRITVVPNGPSVVEHSDTDRGTKEPKNERESQKNNSEKMQEQKKVRKCPAVLRTESFLSPMEEQKNE